MLSRFSSNLTKFSPLIGRYVSTNTAVLYNNKKPRENRPDAKSNEANKNAKSNRNLQNTGKNSNKLVFKDEIKSVLDDLKIEQRGVINAEKYFKHRDKYDLILNSLNSDPKLDELILACQKLIELNELEPLVAQNFNSDPLRKRTIDSLKRHLKDMKDADFFIAVQFMLLYDFNNFHIVQPHLANRNKNFNLDQIIKLATILRLSKVPREETSNLYRTYLSQIRENVEKIDNIKSLKMALVIFSFEASVVKRLDNIAMRLVENLTSQECAELINSKSILRQKNLLVLEACAYNIIKRKDQDKLGVDYVQKCLLSCGVLGFNEPQFFKSLLESLSSELEKNGSNLEWLKQNSKTLESICTSIGIMKLREDASLNALCAVLNKNKTELPLDLIIKFIISCAHLYYKPTLNGSEKEFKELVEFVKPDSFDLAVKEDKVKLMNYVWSTCALDSADSNLVSTVLDESFWKPLLESMNSRELKLFLMKLLNVNLYALALIENYQGNSVPETFDITQYTQILVPAESDEKNMLIAALSSMRKTDKYVKFRLLTPFGILIDAFMLIDKKGEPCELSQSENDDLIKVAFKLTQRNDYNSINSTLNGVLSFQLRLLEELGYKTVTISKEELRSNSLTNRVSLIQKKLKKLTPVT